MRPGICLIKKRLQSLRAGRLAYQQAPRPRGRCAGAGSAASLSVMMWQAVLDVW